MDRHENALHAAFADIHRPAAEYPAAGHQRVLAALQRDLSERRHLLCVIGPWGSGKTALLRALRRTVQGGLVGFIEQPTPGQLLVDLAKSMQLDVNGSNESLLRRRIVMLLAMVDQQKQPIIQIVDAADTLTRDDLNLLLHFFPPGHASLVLAAETPPDAWLAGCASAAGEPQVDFRYELDGWSAAETADYIRHRLRSVSLSEDYFDPALLALIQQRSGGRPGLVNRLALEAMASATGVLAERRSDAEAEGVADTVEIADAAVIASADTSIGTYAETSVGVSADTVDRNTPVETSSDTPVRSSAAISADASIDVSADTSVDQHAAPAGTGVPTEEEDEPQTATQIEAVYAQAPRPSSIVAAADSGAVSTERASTRRPATEAVVRSATAPATVHERRRRETTLRPVIPAHGTDYEEVRLSRRTRRLRRSVRIWRGMAALAFVVLAAVLIQDGWRYFMHPDRITFSGARDEDKEFLPGAERVGRDGGHTDTQAEVARRMLRATPGIPPDFMDPAAQDTDFAALHAPSAREREAIREPSPSAGTATPAPAAQPPTHGADQTRPASAASGSNADTESRDAATRKQSGADSDRASTGAAPQETAPAAGAPLTRAQREDIGRLYAERAEYEWRNGQIGAAALSVRRGLESDPDNPQLLQMRTMLQGLMEER